MGDSDCWSIFLEQFATENGAYINQSDGVYMLGQMYSFDKKLEVVAVFWLALIWDYQQGKKVKHGVVPKYAVWVPSSWTRSTVRLWYTAGSCRRPTYLAALVLRRTLERNLLTNLTILCCYNCKWRIPLAHCWATCIGFTSILASWLTKAPSHRFLTAF